MPQHLMAGSSRKRILLQARDRHLFHELSFMRVIDREQAKLVAGYRSTRRVNDRLLALTRAGLLRRFFIGTPAGWKKSLYSLSERSAKLINVRNRGPRRRQDEIVTVDFFLNHQLGVNEIYCLLKYGSPQPGLAQLQDWKCFFQPIDPDGALIPDAYAA